MPAIRASILIGIAVFLPGPAPRLSAQADVASAKQEELVTITGCVHGSQFKRRMQTNADVPATIANASEWVLDGKRELLQQLRSGHDGHEEEITGTIKLPPTPHDDQAHIRTKPVGKKTTVTIGQREATTITGPAPPRPVRIVVASFRHVADNCAIK